MNGKRVLVARAVGRLCLLFGLLSLLAVPTLNPISASHGGGNGDRPHYTASNGDGYADLAVGVPWEDIGGQQDAGAVNVLYGSAPNGLSATGDQGWNQDSTDIWGTAEVADYFGEALTGGDFNGDGYIDLAVGVPWEDVQGVGNAGAVNVLYGSASGLSAMGDQGWHQNSTGITDTAEINDKFGSALAAGDFDGDGYADLAVGIPREDVGVVVDAGAVHILYGSAAGLSATENQLWHQDVPDIWGTAETADYFGAALVAGDFDGDGYADLAVGVPYEDVGAVGDAGAVNILYGSASGLSATGDQGWQQDSTGITDTAEAGDEFGSALAAGDFDGDGRADLAVGIPREDVGAVVDAGAVHILYGSAAGLSATGDQLWHQDVSGIWGTAEVDDKFGSALAAGDLNGDGHVDLAVGVPYEDIGAVADAGAVNVLYGSASGLSATGDQGWQQDSTDVEDTAEAGDRFGSALAASDFNGDGCNDLAVGVPYEDLGVQDAGAVNVLYGSAAGLSVTGNQLWHQDVPGIWGTAEAFDFFGYALAALNPVKYHVCLPLVLCEFP